MAVSFGLHDVERRGKLACMECRRKKSKCDTRLPSCSTCLKTKSGCVYPTQRKARRTGSEREVAGELRKPVPCTSRAFPNTVDPVDSVQTSGYQRILEDDTIAPSLYAFDSVGAGSLSWGNGEDADTTNYLSLPLSLGFDPFDFESHEVPYYDAPTLDSMTDIEVRHGTSTYSLGVPASTVVELVEQFFDKVQNFLPLFHRPRFYEQYISKGFKDQDYDALSLEAALILNGMLALSARFSTSTYFSGTEPSSRGDKFGRRAKAIYDELISGLDTPTLPFLQGCVLLGFYLLSSEPSTQGWLVCGTCSRIACELELDRIDQKCDAASRPQLGSGITWSKTEERRRAWWSVWELEVVASTMCRRPHTITKARAMVMLPVSDEAWFADEEVLSAIIPPDPLRAWQTLRDCPNQDERAWFLVGNYLIFCVHDMLHQRQHTPKDVNEIDTAITGFMQLLPGQFRITAGIVFDAKNFRRANHIVSTLLMLQGSRIYVKFLKQLTASNLSTDQQPDFLAPVRPTLQSGSALSEYSPYVQSILDIVHEWPPEFISMNTPFISTLLLGPAKINLRLIQQQELIDKGENNTYSIASAQREILGLAIQQVATYWKFGSVLLNEFCHTFSEK